MKTAFDYQVQALDYENNAASIINYWVSRCTNGKIKNLFSDLSPETTCVLVNCIYFKGEWRDGFKPYKTTDRSFYCTVHKTSTVKMMCQEEKNYLYRAFDEKGFKCLKIPYKDTKFRMMIVLPDERFGLSDVMKSLDAETFEGLANSKDFEIKKSPVEIALI